MSVKDLVCERTRARTSEFVRRHEIPEEGACLYLAYFGALELAGIGFRPLLQAGSAGWPRVRPEGDDGAVMTHFSYVWAPEEEKSRRARASGLMPEMHVWIGLPDTEEIVDFSTGLFPVQAKKLMGYDWPEDLLPPDYFWGGPEALGRAYYSPNMSAIRCALGYIHDIFGEEKLAELLKAGQRATEVSPLGGPGPSSNRARLLHPHPESFRG